MDPLSITVTVRQDVRAARSDLDTVSRELFSLKTVLELLVEDVTDATNETFPQTLRKQITGIVTNCTGVVIDIERTLKEHDGDKLSKAAHWVAFGKSDVVKLRSSLEAHKSALEIALDMVTLSMAREITSDTRELLNDTSAIKGDTAQILAEIARLQEKLPQEVDRNNASGFMLERYLDNLTSYADTVFDTLSDETSGSENGSITQRGSTSPTSQPSNGIENDMKAELYAQQPVEGYEDYEQRRLRTFAKRAKGQPRGDGIRNRKPGIDLQNLSSASSTSAASCLGEIEWYDVEWGPSSSGRSEMIPRAVEATFPVPSPMKSTEPREELFLNQPKPADANRGANSPGYTRREINEAQQARRRKKARELNPSFEREIQTSNPSEDPTPRSHTAEDIKRLNLKGLFNVSTTSTKPVHAIRADIIRVLRLLQIEFTEIRGGFSCRHYTEDNDGIGELLKVQFGILLVKVPLLSLHGVQFKKLEGKIWQYRDVANRILMDRRLWSYTLASISSIPGYSS